MKATVCYKIDDGWFTRKTIEVSKNEPNLIIREFISATGYSKYMTYVSKIKCGALIYMWLGTCESAYAKKTM